MNIRETDVSDIPAIRQTHTLAFGEAKGPVIADLTVDLLSDKTAMPVLSLAAEENQRMIGHILYTKVRITPEAGKPVSASILAPLAVIPDAQKTGVGGQLIREGFSRLKEDGVDLVFVLGHPSYYPRHGFSPAGKLGFEAPYPIPEEHAAAWMVMELGGGIIGTVEGIVQCAKSLDRPEHWRE